MFGNSSAEATDDNESLRPSVVEVLDSVISLIEYRLKAAVKAGTRTKDLAATSLHSKGRC